MNNTERLINAGEKLSAAVVRRIADLRQKPIESGSLVEQAADDGIEAQGPTSHAVKQWLLDEGGVKWAGEWYGFHEGRSRPIMEGKYEDDLPDRHRKLLGRVLSYINDSVERGLVCGISSEPSNGQIDAVQDDNRATFRDGANFGLAWDWVEDVGHGVS